MSADNRSRLGAVEGLSKAGSPAVMPPPPRPVPASTPPLSAVPDRQGETDSTPAAPAPRPPEEERRPFGQHDPSDDIERGITLSLPLSVERAAKKHAKTSGTTRATVLMDALVDQMEVLGELVAGTKPRTTRDALGMRRSTKPVTEAKVPFSVRILMGNLKVIDSLVKRHGATDRSQLCAAALRAYLLDSPPEE